MFGQSMHIDRARHQPFAGSDLLDFRSLEIEFVLDFAEKLFKQILKGDEPKHLSVLVDYQCDPASLAAQLVEKIAEKFSGRNAKRGTNQPFDSWRSALQPARD